jgi:hypothetical protein
MQRQQFAVVDAYPDREYYRYAFRGQWAPFLGQSVEARLQPVEHTEGETLRTNVSASVPEGVEAITIRLTNGTTNTSASNYTTVPVSESLDLGMETNRNRTRLVGTDESVSIPTPDSGTVTLIAFVDFGADRAVKYRVALPVNRTGTGVEALTPRLEVCWSERWCGGQAAYVPDAQRDDIRLNATVDARP